MLLRSPNFTVTLAFSFSVALLAGCGGSGSSGGSSPSPVPSHYIFDPSFPPVTSVTVIPSGYSAAGAWMPIVIADNQGSAGGYYVGSTYTAFPASKVNGTNVSTEAAGGHYVWATYTTASGGYGTAILDLSSGKIVQVDNTFLSNEGICSPDGTSAMVSLYDSSGNDTGGYALLSATGTLTPFPITNTPGYVVESHANSGWTVVLNTASEAARNAARRSHLKGSGIAHPFSSSNIALLISPKGVVTPLQGTNPQANCVNDSGVAAGFETTASGGSIPVKWDASGKETVLKSINADGSGGVFGINDKGVMVGGNTSDATPAMLWQVSGSVTNLTNLVEITGKETFSTGVEIQGTGTIFGYGTDSSGNGGDVAITPSLK